MFDLPGSCCKDFDPVNQAEVPLVDRSALVIELQWLHPVAILVLPY